VDETSWGIGRVGWAVGAERAHLPKGDHMNAHLAPWLSNINATRVLFLSRKDCFHRQVVSFELRDDQTAVQKTSLLVELPREVACGTPLAVPLGVVRRRSMYDFSVLDEQGRALPLLTVPQVRAVTTELFEPLLRCYGYDRSNGNHVARLHALLQTSWPPSSRDTPLLMHDWERELAKPEEDLVLPQALTIARSLKLASDNFMLLAILEKPAPGRLQVLKYSHEVPFFFDHGRRGAVSVATAWTGFISSGVRFDVQPICDNVHVEVTAPANTLLSKASLDRRLPLTGTWTRRAEVLATDLGPFHRLHPHIRLDETPERPRPRRWVVRRIWQDYYRHDTQGLSLWVWLRARRSGWVTAALVAATLIFLSLVGIDGPPRLAWLPFLGRRLDWVAAQLYLDELHEAPTVGAGLLAAIGLLGGLLVRDAGHAVTAKLLAYPRLLLTIASVASFVRALQLMLKGAGGDRDRSAVLLSGLCLVGILLYWLAPSAARVLRWLRDVKRDFTAENRAWRGRPRRLYVKWRGSRRHPRN
jgi:hypothetical protein